MVWLRQNIRAVIQSLAQLSVKLNLLDSEITKVTTRLTSKEMSFPSMSSQCKSKEGKIPGITKWLAIGVNEIVKRLTVLPNTRK